MYYLFTIQIIIFGLTLGFISATIYDFASKKLFPKKYVIVKGLHFHHDLFGVIAVISCLFIPDLTIKIFLFCFGIGIILQHQILYKRHFIDREL